MNDMNKNQINQIKNMILNGLSLAEIGRRCGVSRQRIHQICKKYGIDLQSLKNERDRRLFSEIERYAKEGYSACDVAYLLSLRYSKVKELAHKNGLKFTSTKSVLDSTQLMKIGS